MKDDVEAGPSAPLAPSGSPPTYMESMVNFFQSNSGNLNPMEQIQTVMAAPTTSQMVGEGVIARFPLEGGHSGSCCGLRGLTHFKEVHFFPKSLKKLKMEKTMREVMDEVDAEFKRSNLPLAPLYYTFLLLPMFFACLYTMDLFDRAIMMGSIVLTGLGLPITIGVNKYCRNQCRKKVIKLVKEWNDRHGLPVGVYMRWNEEFLRHINGTNPKTEGGQVIITKHEMILEVIMNVEKHQSYCEENGLNFSCPQMLS